MSYDTILALLDALQTMNDNLGSCQGANPLLNNINPFMVSFITIRILQQIKAIYDRLDSRCLKLQQDMVDNLLQQVE